METDISELLLKNHPMVSSSSTPPAPQSEGDAAAAVAVGAEEINPEGQSSEVIPPKKPHLRDVDADSRRFRELLLFGRKKVCVRLVISRDFFYKSFVASKCSWKKRK